MIFRIDAGRCILELPAILLDKLALRAQVELVIKIELRRFSCVVLQLTISPVWHDGIAVLIKQVIAEANIPFPKIFGPLL